MLPLFLLNFEATSATAGKAKYSKKPIILEEGTDSFDRNCGRDKPGSTTGTGAANKQLSEANCVFPIGSGMGFFR